MDNNIYIEILGMFGCWLLVVGCWLLVVGCWFVGFDGKLMSPGFESTCNSWRTRL